MAEVDVDQFLDVLSEGLTLQEDGCYLGDDAGLLIRERDTAIREAAKLEALDEVVELGLELMKMAMVDTRLDDASRLAALSGGVFCEAIRKTKEKYRK